MAADKRTTVRIFPESSIHQICQESLHHADEGDAI
jgi:hypothetical protein